MNIVIGKKVGVIAAILISCFIVSCGEQGRTGRGSNDLIPTTDLGTTIGSLVEMSWPESIRLEGYNLVVGLRGTGSSECPPQIRTYLGQHIQRLYPERKINIEKFIRGPETAVVLVEGIMPAVASQDEYFDVRVTALPGTQTTSLEGGWLLGAELKTVGTFGITTNVVADAKAKNGKQLWVGPAKGGNDHIMAMKTWKAAGITAKWIPYKSGGKAMAALMGGHGVVYVGNPQDVLGRPDLMVAVISAPNRLSGKYADVPTFKEVGISGMDNEIMWRGFMVKKGIPADARAFYEDLFEKVSKDQKWQAYIKKGGANPVYYKEDKFKEIIKKDAAVFTATLKELGILK